MFKKLFKAEGGFTLIELLVTIAILAVMFGIVTLTLGGVGSDAKTIVCAAETAVVQAAMDIWLASKAVNSIPTGPVAPAAGIAIVGTTNSPPSQFQDYLKGTTTGTYQYGVNGVGLNQDTCP